MEESRLAKKKIMLVSNSAWSIYNFRLDCVVHLRARFEVVVVAAPDDFVGDLTRAGCRFVPVQFNNRSENPFADIRLYRALKDVYRRERPDFIFHYVIKPNIYGSLAASALGVPSVAVITGLGYAFAKENLLSRLVRNLYRRALKRSRENWFLNHEDAEAFVAQRIVPEVSVHVLPGEGVNTKWFSPPEYRPVARNKAFSFLMNTRLLRSKGVAQYARAAAVLQKEKYGVRFNLLGFFEEHHPDSIDRADLERWKKRGILAYQGFAKDVRPALVEADCVVFPSRYNEGIPRCLLEAAAMAVPVITTNNRGCREVVEDGVTGFLCRTGETGELVEKMRMMMDLTSAERAVMGRKARERVMARFGIERILAEYDRVTATIG